MLEKEFQYYLKNQQELVKKYNGEFIVIKNETVIGHYTNPEDALTETQKEHSIGTFLIQFCEPGEESYTQHFHSRVAFA